MTPGDNKNIFPQVLAPTMEFSTENSVSKKGSFGNFVQKKMEPTNQKFEEAQERIRSKV